MKSRSHHAALCRAVTSFAVLTSVLAVSAAVARAQAGAGIPSSLGNVAEPIQTVAGAIIGGTNAPGVQVLDVWNNPVTNTPVTVAPDSEAFASGITNVLTDTNGVARFTNLVLTKAQSGYRLVYAASNGISSTSAPFPVVAAAPARSEITVQPSNSIYGSPVPGFPTLVVYDQYTNAVRNGVGIRATISANGFRSGSTTNLSTDANGRVVFSNLVPGAAGTNYMIAFDTQSAGVDDTNSASFDVAQLGLTIGGSFAANNKAYDGSNNATIGTDALSLVTPLSGDDVNLAAVATFSQATIGTNLLVSLTNSSLTGSATNNYTLSFAGAPTDTADITASPLTIGGSFASENKTYNGSNNAVISTNALVLVTPAPVDQGDTNRLRLEAVAVFSQAGAGTNVVVNLTNSTLAGSSATNYAISFVGAPLATNSILPLQLTIAGGFTSADKNYDGVSNATVVSNGLSLVTPVPGDDVALDAIATFPQVTIGSSLVISLANSKLTGSATNNYTLSFAGAPTATNSITPRPVTITNSFGVSNRPYNGSNNAVIASNGLALNNVINADTNSVLLEAVATFNPFTVGTNTAFLTNSYLTNRPSTGTAYTNYILVTSNAPTAVGVISGRLVTITGNFSAADRSYNGSNNATITSNNLSLVGLQGGDTNTVSLDAVATFAQATVGTNIVVSLENSSLSGSNSANYNLSFASAPTDTADIMPAPLNIGGAFLAAGKIYDGTNSAVITSNNLTLLTPAPIDRGNTNILRLVPVAAFSQSFVGTNLTVSLTTNSSLAGSSATNYFLTNFAGAPTTTAGISNRPVYITGLFGVSNKVYDNSATASFSISNLVLSNLAGTDSNAVALAAIATFDPFTAGTNPVFLTNSFLTNKVGTTNPGTFLNYTLSFSNAPTNTAVISNRPVMVIGSFTSTNKVYDNTVAATIDSNALALTNFAPGEGSGDVALVPEAVFNQPTVGTNIRVFLSTNSYLTNSKAPNYVLNLSNSPATSNNITARSLEVTVGASTVIAGQNTNALNPPPAITASNLATNDTVASVVGTNTNYTSTVLAATSTNRSKSGVYSNDLGVLTAGSTAANYSITTNLGTLTIVASNASMISIVADPLQTTAGEVIPGLNLTNFSNMPPSVRVTDAFANIVTNFNVSVSLSSNSFASGATSVTTDANGLASFTNLLVTNAGAGYYLSYTGLGITNAPVQSEQFSVIAAAAAKLNILQPPQSTNAGDNFNPPPRVQMVDQYGNPVLTGPYTISASVDPSATIFGPTVQTNNTVDGTATFSNISIRKAGQYTMAFTPAGAGLEVTNSQLFNISANTNSARVSIVAQPSNSIAGSPVFPNPVLLVQDQYNNVVTNQSLSASLLQNTNNFSYATNSTTNLLTGTNGQATFSNLVINQANTNYAAVFSLPYMPPFGAGSVTSVTFAITHADVNAFSFAPITPTNQVAGVNFPVTITAIDRFSNTITAFSNSVSLTLNTNSLASGTPAGPFVSGVLSNHQVAIRVTNNDYRMTATFTNGSTNAFGTSGGFSVRSAAAANILLTGPTNVVAGSTSSNFTLTVYDQFTNVAPVTNNTLFSLLTSQETNSATFAPASLTISNNTSSGTFTYRNTKVGTTNHTITVTYSNGDAGLVGDTTNATIAVLPGNAASLVLVTQPAPTAAAGVTFTQQPVVRLVDQFTNVVSSNVAVSAAIASGSPALEGVSSIATASNGIASFTNLAIGGVPGTRTLNFTSTGLVSVTSSNVNVGVGSAASITLVEEPSQVPAGDKITNGTSGKFPTVRVADKYTNSITNQAVTVALTPTNNFAIGSATNATTAVNGEAVFTNLAVTNAFSPYQLAFRAGSASNSSRQFAVVAAEPTNVLVDMQPSTTIAGRKVAGPPTARLLDTYGNPVNDTTVAASLRIGTNGTNFVAGSTTSGASGNDGRVAFTNLTINRAGTNYSIVFNTFVAGSPSNTTTNFAVVADLANPAITVTTQPSNSIAGSPVPGFPTVQVRDQFSNNVSGTNVFVSLNTNGFLPGSATNVTLSTNGTAAFTNLRIGPAWTNYTLRFVLQGYTNVGTNGLANSRAFTNSASNASKLVLTQQPSSTNQAGKVFTTQPVVRLQDAFDNNVTSPEVQIVAGLASGSPALLGSTNVSTVGGAATFSSLRIDGTVGVRTLSFTSTNGLTGVTSSIVTITPGDLAGLSILTQPVRTVAGENILGSSDAPLRVRATDSFTNNVPGISVTPAPDGFFFAGSSAPVATDSNGIASFASLSTTEAGANYFIAFSSGALSTNSARFNVIPATPEDLDILQQPFGGVVGSPLAPNPRVQLTDRFGNPTTDATPYNIGVRMIGSTFTGGSTTTVMTGAEGKATFTDLVPATNGSGVVLEFDIDGAPVASSTQFNIIGTNQFQPNVVSFVSLAGSAADLEVGTPRTLVATLLNAAGQTVTNSSANVTFAAVPGTGGTVSGLATVGASNGIASNTVTGLAAGEVILGASAPSGSGTATSEPLSFTVVGVELAILRIERTTSNPAVFAMVPQPKDAGMTVQSAPGETVVQITFKVNPGHNFTVWKAPSLGAAWAEELSGTAQDVETIVELPISPAEGQGFYRISAEPGAPTNAY